MDWKQPLASVSKSTGGILGIPMEAWAVLCLGFAFRLHAFFVTAMVNPDAALYIQQAKAIWYGSKGQLLACSSYFSIYPLFIYLCHFLLSDWINAAKVVSLFFGTLALVPLFYLTRQFLKKREAVLCLLAVAVNPTFVVGSSSVERDPVYWFFASLGILVAILSLKEEKPPWMIVSSLSFLLAAWARTEALVYVVGTILFFLVYRPVKLANILYFLLPIVLVALMGCGLLFVSGQVDFSTAGFNRVLTKATGAIFRYHSLRTHLEGLIKQWSQTPGGSTMMFFFTRARNLIWLIALASVVIQIKRGLFWPAFVLFVLGFSSIRKMLRGQREFAYLLLLGIMGFLALYIQTMSSWAMVSRYTALVSMPLLVVVGLGASILSHYFTKRLGWKQSWCIILFWAVLIGPGLYKELRVGSHKNIILKDIGEAIAKREKGQRAIEVAGSLRRMQLVHLYANLEYHGAPCFDYKLWLKPHDLDALNHAIMAGLDYFVWNDKFWTEEDLAKLEQITKAKIRKVASWRASKYGQIRLFKIIKMKHS